MKETTVKLMLRALERHFQQPVHPVDVYCGAFRTWRKALLGRAERLRASLFPGIDGPPDDPATVAAHASYKARIYSRGIDDSGQLDRLRRYQDTLDHLDGIFRDISKSNLLARLIYGSEKLRTKECSIHKGTWHGINECPEGCDQTGWLPEPVEARSNEVSVLDVVEVNAVVVGTDMRRWLAGQGWAPSPAPHNPRIELWKKLVRHAGSTEEVIIRLPFDDTTPDFARWVEDAVYLIAEKFGGKPSRILIEINSGSGSLLQSGS